MREGRPTELTYQCTRVMLGEPSDSTMARYFAEKLRSDMVRYREAATRVECQGDTGSFPLIRRSNEIAAALLEKAMEVAVAGARGEIDYPGISYP